MNNKSYSMLLMVFVIGILLIGSVSAAKIKYEDNDMKVNFKKSFLGIGTSDLGSVELKSHKSVDEIRRLGAGENQAVMYYDFNGWKKYEEGLGEVIFIDMETGEEIEKDYYFAELTYEQQQKFKTICEERFLTNGSKYSECSEVKDGFKQVEVWKRLETNDIPGKNVRIGLITDVEVGDYMDAVWSIAGKKVKKHAVWSASLNVDLVNYYKLDEGSGAVIDSTENINVTNSGATNTTGIILSAYDFESTESDKMTGDSLIGISGDQARTISFWYKKEDNVSSEIISMGGGGVKEGFRFRLGSGGTALSIVYSAGLATASNVTPQDAEFHHYAANYDGNFVNVFIDGDITGNESEGALSTTDTTLKIGTDQTGAAEFVDGVLDEIGIWNRSLSSLEIKQLYNNGNAISFTTIFGPIITLNSPADNLETTDREIIFNGTVQNATINEVANVSFILDGVFNETNSTGISNVDYIFTKILSPGIHTWVYESCDNESLCTNSSQRSFEILNFIENSITFTSEVLETSSQEFELNITTFPQILSISAFLNYNGTRHSSTTVCEDQNCTITNIIDVPLTLTGESENKSFLWEVTAFDGTTSESTNSTTNQQNVSRIHLEECDATFTTQALNFTVYDEQNLSRISQFLFDATFDQWLGTGTVKRESNFTNSSLSEEALCILPSDDTFFIDAIIEYDEAGNESIYTLRNYFFQNDTISNVSQDIFMYLLKSSDSTSFILKVQDDSLLPVPGVLIEINRFYPGTDEFRIVQIAQTDDSGKSVGFFETEIVDYKFLITLNDETLLETGLQKVIPESSPFTLTFNIGDPLGKPWSSQEPIEDLNSTLVWNDDSGIVTYIYIDNSTIFSLGRLLVIKENLVNATNNTIVCNVNSSFSSATLTCTVGSTNGFYIASSFITRNSTELLDKQFGFNVETLSGVVGLLGLFYGWFLILIASFMFKFNEIAGIWAVTITVFMVNLMGLISFGGVFVTATIAVALILTWIMER